MREGQSVWPESQFSLLFVIFSNKTLSTLYYFSVLSSLLLKSACEGWFWLSLATGSCCTILLRLLFVTVSHWQMYSVPFNVSEKVVPVQWQFSFFSVPLSFFFVLFIALSWEKSCEISCQLGVNFLCSVIAAVLKPCVYSFYIPCILLFPKVIFNLDWTWI